MSSRYGAPLPGPLRPFGPVVTANQAVPDSVKRCVKDEDATSIEFYVQAADNITFHLHWGVWVEGGGVSGWYELGEDTVAAVAVGDIFRKVVDTKGLPAAVYLTDLSGTPDPGFVIATRVIP